MLSSRRLLGLSSENFCISRIWGSHGGEYEDSGFWIVAPCSLVEVHQRFKGPCCPCDRPNDGGRKDLCLQTTRRYNTEDSHLHFSVSFSTKILYVFHIFPFQTTFPSHPRPQTFMIVTADLLAGVNRQEKSATGTARQM
jgi:hypothetical protein